MSLDAPGLDTDDFDPFAQPALERVVPTTDAQREVWFASRLSPEASLAYNESISLRIRGPLDAGALRAALQAVVARHDALRASFSEDGTELLVAASIELPFDETDGGARPDDAIAAARDAAVSRPFDLSAGPLVRATLVRIGADAHELVIAAHHAVCDGWSFAVIARETMALYDGLANGRGVVLPAPDPFAVHALEQASDDVRRTVASDLAWWTAAFADPPEPADLPADRPRGPSRTFRSRREDLQVDAAWVDAARRLGSRHGASLFVTLFAGFAATLQRLTAHADLVIGVPAAAQAVEGRERLVGHCVRLLPVRTTVEPGRPFAQWVESVRHDVLDAYEHQSCTLGSILGALALGRDASRPPLAATMFNLDAAVPDATVSTPSLSVSLHGNPRRFENFELFLNATQTASGIVLECQYNEDLFDAGTIRRWLALFRDGLARAAADPSAPVGDAFAPTGDDAEAMRRFNDTARTRAAGERIDRLFARQAAATPQAIALVADGRATTYATLRGRVAAVAGALRARGIGRGDLVGLHCRRGEDMVVGLLGVLASGAGYVPMDPSFPAERLEYMRTASGLRAVIGHAAGDASVMPDIDIGSVGSSDAPLEPAPGGTEEDIAYVIYTSGSTGRPKGVTVPHRSVCNFLASMRREPGLATDDRLLAITTLSFDIAVLELLLPLTVGARVVVARREDALDGEALAALIASEGITVMQGTPTTWHLLLDARWRAPAGFRAFCGGEPLPPALASRLLDAGVELWNLYGPTETTVWSTVHRVLDATGAIPIGHPIDNTRVAVVDDALRPVPLGGIGELLIGGDGLALGYHGQPELTAERFVTGPALGAGRWYRTGDLGRWRPDGRLECLGRRDHQVKVRGYRIELGEIEVVLAAHPQVDRAVVVVREDEPGDPRIVGYVVAAAADGLEDALRAHARGTLPEYMVPARVLRLDALPLLPNGKVDRKALPAPQSPAAPSQRARRAPRTPTEAQVLSLFEAILKLPGLDPDDDFFLLGGHSLLAARLTARVNADFALQLPLRTVFEHATPARLAVQVDAAARDGGEDPHRVPRRAAQDVAPLTVMQQRIRFVETLHPGRVTYNTPSAHRLAGPFDARAFATALRMLVRRQPALRSYVDDSGAEPLQRVAESVDIELPVEDLSSLPAERREVELMRRMQAIVDAPIDIHRAPLFRTALYRLGPEEHAFLFMPHHLVWDGWSFDLLYEEMAALYPAALAGRGDPLPPLEVTYGDFAEWQARWIDGEACRAQRDYWRARFAGAERAATLPTDRPRTAGMTGTGAVEWVRVDASLTESLRRAATASGVTLNMFVMAVYAAMLAEPLDTDELVIGLPVRGRLSTQLEPVMGFFNNLLPIRLALDRALPLEAWARVVRAEMLGGFAHQDVPFELLSADPAIGALSGRGEPYQSLFSFQDARERQRDWGPLRHGSILIMQKGATEDFGLWLMEVPGGLEGGFNYNADLFDATTAVLFRERLVDLLAGAAADTTRTIDALLSRPSDAARALRAWSEARRAEAPVGASRPAPVGAAAVEDASPGPSSPGETALARIWAEVLSMPSSAIRREDNFFDLGGNSLQAMQAVSRMEAESGRTVEARRYVFDSLAQLAAAYEAAPAARPKARRGLLGRLFGRDGG
jgi:amino acid adenylation domain-containing protein